jgi:hypothetical protein
MHVHNSDRIFAAAIFANGTYFVNTPGSFLYLYGFIHSLVSASGFIVCFDLQGFIPSGMRQ